jgi:hypothetical protein
MRTGEIVDLSNERRLSAVLDITPAGAELLILNGGSRAEEFAVFTIGRGRARKERRSAYCIDSGTSMLLTIPLAPGESPRDIVLRIVGGHGEMMLSAPARPVRGSVVSLRGWSSVAAAFALLLLAGGRIDGPGLVASADPEPAPVDDPLVKASVSLRVPERLPSVVTRPALDHRPAVTIHIAKSAEHHATVAFAAPPPAPIGQRHTEAATTPEPRMTDLRVPTTARSGDFVPVAFGAVGRQVKIVASIGPTIVSKTIIAAQRGVIAIRSPKSDLDSRVMTVRAYAQDGNRTSTLQAMVVLVHP